MFRVLPSILTNSADEFVELANQVPKGTSLHIDFIDGKFADNKTLSPVEVKNIESFRTKSATHDAHLMVAGGNLIKWVDDVAAAKFARIIIHLESLNEWSVKNKRNRHQFFRLFEKFSNGVVWGVAIDLPTPVIEEAVILESVGVVLIMSVKAGFGGQKFDRRSLEKIKVLSETRERHGYSYKICVDGGITPENVKSVFNAGADEVAIGRRLFKGNVKDRMREYIDKIS